MKTFLLALVFLSVGVAGMAISILVKKDGHFPDGEISHNKELRKRGIICAKEEELRLWGRKKARRNLPDGWTCPDGGCDSCAFGTRQRQ